MSDTASVEPEVITTTDPSNEGQHSAQEPNKDLKQGTPAQAEPNTDNGADPDKGKKQDNAQMVPMDRFSAVYKRMKAAERKLEEKEKAVGQPPAAGSPSSTARQDAPNWADYEAAGKTAEEFNADWIDHKVKTTLEAKEKADRAKADDDAQLDRESKAMANVQRSAATASRRHADYQEKLKGAQELGIQFHPALELAIAESDDPGELGYQLAKDTDKAFELMALPVDKALIRLGQYLAKMPSGNSQPAKMTNTEPPPIPLNGGGKAPLQYAPAMSDADFDRLFPPD